MYCNHCGKEITDGSTFCIHCGASQSSADAPTAVHSTPTATAVIAPPPQKRIQPKKLIPVVAVLALIAAGTVVGVKLYQSPTAQMNRAIADHDLALAYDIYTHDLEDPTLSQRTVSLLVDAANKISEDCLGDVVSYDESDDALWYIRQFTPPEEDETLSTAISTTSDAIWTHHRIGSLMEDAAQNMEGQMYQAAKSSYEEILALDPDNADAASGLAAADKAYLQSLMDAADKDVQNGNYKDAIATYEKILELDPDRTDVTTALIKTQDDYRKKFLQKAEAYMADNEYDSATDVIEDALEYDMVGDAPLTAFLNTIHTRKIEWIVSNVQEQADGGNWDGALEILDSYQQQYPNETLLTDTRTDILREMPISLKNITTISYKKVSVIDDVVTDRYGNIYDGAVKFESYYNAYALVNLSKNYTAFQATAFITKSKENNVHVQLSIYLDEELAYYQEDITEETEPIAINLDVTGASTMRIVTQRLEKSDYLGTDLIFGDSTFVKVADEAG